MEEFDRQIDVLFEVVARNYLLMIDSIFLKLL